MSTTRSQFEVQLETIRHRLLEMGSSVDRMLGLAMQALQERDVDLAESVIALDDDIDDMDLSIEADCLKVIALQNPVARDLHLVGTALKVITDLERIGDHSVDIAKVARHIASESFAEPLVDIPSMADAVRRMIRDALSAFVNHDLNLVAQVVEADDDIDRRFHVLRNELHEVMRNSPPLVVQASYLLFVAHYLERIADHTVNIAERVYFAETGQFRQLAESHRTGS